LVQCAEDFVPTANLSWQCGSMSAVGKLRCPNPNLDPYCQKSFDTYRINKCHHKYFKRSLNFLACPLSSSYSTIRAAFQIPVRALSNCLLLTQSAHLSFSHLTRISMAVPRVPHMIFFDRRVHSRDPLPLPASHTIEEG